MANTLGGLSKNELGALIWDAAEQQVQRLIAEGLTRERAIEIVFTAMGFQLVGLPVPKKESAQ